VLARLRDESGGALVLVSLTMVVMLSFTAFVADLGPVYVERRLAQTAADAAVLAGAQSLGQGPMVAAQEAMELARENLRIQYSDAEWAALWAPGSCPAPPAGYAVPAAIAGTTDCIALNSGGTRMWVRIPDQVLAASFSRVIGVEELRTSAAAEAQIDYVPTSPVLPFGVPLTAGDSGEACLKTSPDGMADYTAPCNGSSSGNFGYLNSPTYGNAFYNTPRQCTGDTTHRAVNNIIMGIDHPLDEYRGPTESPYEPDEAQRFDECDVPAPNTMYVKTGNMSNSVLDNGLVDGEDYAGGPGRLVPRVDLGWAKRRVTHVWLENKPLWEFIDPSLTTADGIPGECLRSTFDPLTGNPTKQHMAECLAAYNSGGHTTPLFTADTVNPGDGVYDIQLSRRFSFLPEFWDATFGSGSSEPHAIKRFRAAFLQTVYFGCDGTGCDIVFNPGEGGTTAIGNPSQKTDALTAFLFKDSMLPASVIASGPGSAGGTVRHVSLIR
jgi:hypothetical protein